MFQRLDILTPYLSSLTKKPPKTKQTNNNKKQTPKSHLDGATE